VYRYEYTTVSILRKITKKRQPPGRAPVYRWTRKNLWCLAWDTSQWNKIYYWRASNNNKKSSFTHYSRYRLLLETIESIHEERTKNIVARCIYIKGESRNYRRSFGQEWSGGARQLGRVADRGGRKWTQERPLYLLFHRYMYKKYNFVLSVG
jgi:hypothetical protein